METIKNYLENMFMHVKNTPEVEKAKAELLSMMEDKYQGIFVNRNYTTYRLGRSIAENEMASREEAKQVFVKNYSKLYTFNDELLDTMVNTSEFPQELLEKLSVYFPAEDKQLFLDRCEQMHKIRLNAINQQTQN